MFFSSLFFFILLFFVLFFPEAPETSGLGDLGPSRLDKTRVPSAPDSHGRLELTRRLKSRSGFDEVWLQSPFAAKKP